MLLFYPIQIVPAPQKNPYPPHLLLVLFLLLSFTLCDTTIKDETGSNRLLPLDPHPRPCAEVGHHLQKARHIRCQVGDKHQVVREPSGRGPKSRECAVPHSSRLEGEEQRIKNKSNQQGRRLVTLLLSPREDHVRRSATRQFRLIVRFRVEGLMEQINVRDVELPLPPPQGRVVNRVECVSRQTTSFNDFSIEAGILLRVEMVFPRHAGHTRAVCARSPDAVVSQPTQLSHSCTHIRSLLTAYLTLALTLRQLISLPSHS
jgi:hypothetical protein